MSSRHHPRERAEITVGLQGMGYLVKESQGFSEASFWWEQMASGHSPLGTSSFCRNHAHPGVQMPVARCLSLLPSPHILDTRSTPARSWLCATMTSHRWRTTTVPLPSRSWRGPSATSSPVCHLRASGRSGRCVGPRLCRVIAEPRSSEALGYSSTHQGP